MSETPRLSRRFEAESVSETREKMSGGGLPFGMKAAHEALQQVLASHDELYATLAEVLSAWEDKSGMGTLYNMRRVMPDVRRLLAKARGETP